MTDVDPRIWQAVIAGLFVAMGWLVNGWQSRRHQDRLRRDRVNDVQRALYAEIRAHVAVLERDGFAERTAPPYAREMAARIRTEPDFFPLIPHERNRTIFSAIVSDIHVLPRAVVDPVAIYYSQLVAIETMIRDLRGLDKARLGAERAARVYEDYVAMKAEALVLGRDAMLMMGGFLSGGAERVRQIEAALAERDADILRRRAPELGREIAEMTSRISSRGGGPSGR